MTERQWAINAFGEYAQCMQKWCRNHDFYYCHWIAESEEYVCCQLDALELESTVVNSLIKDMFKIVSAYRASDDILRQYLKADGKW